MNLNEQIQNRIDELMASCDNDPADLRGVARRLQALPIFPDISGCLALRPDGSLVFCEWDTWKCSEEIELEFRLAGLVRGSEKYPELKSLLPKRPEAANDCEGCKGSGRFMLEGQVLKNMFCGKCSGLGWTQKEDLKLQ